MDLFRSKKGKKEIIFLMKHSLLPFVLFEEEEKEKGQYDRL